MFVSAILLPPAKPVTNADDKARELGALVVVNGGRFKLGDAASFAAQLFVGAEQISVRDSRRQSFLEIPVGEITSALTKEFHGRWFLCVNWGDKTAAFAYDGVFAEHDGFSIWLTTENGIEVTNRICLEPDVFRALTVWKARIERKEATP